MSRDASGNYTPPAGNPVVSGTTIDSAWANDTVDDIGSALTDSLDRSGKGGMLAPLKIANGTRPAPGLSFNTEPGSGLYRNAAGDLRMAVLGQDALLLAQGALTSVSQSPGSTIGPTITAFRDSSSPADADALGALVFSGRSSTAAIRNYAVIATRADTVANGAEVGYLGLYTMQAGALTPVFQAAGSNLTITGTVTIAGTVTLGAITISNLTVSTAATFAGATIANLGIVTTADINGGTLDGVTIGAAAAAAGTFTAVDTATFAIGGVGVTATALELNVLDGITATTAELNLLDGVTATTAEINFIDGVTSAIQVQLNAKASNASPTFTGTVTVAALTASGTVTAANFIGNGSGITGLPPQAPVLNTISSNTTAVVGEAYVADTSAGAFTLTLPPTPTAGNLVSFTDYAGTFKLNNLTLGRNGSPIVGVAQDLVIDLNYASLRMLYIDATEGWIFL